VERSDSVARHSALLAVRVPGVLPGVHYRAYAERLRNESVLDWLLTRFCEIVPPGVPVVFVCESESERRYLMAACGRPDQVEFLCADGQSEVHQCRLLMDRHQVQRLVMIGLSHVVAPARVVRDLLALHVAMRSELTTPIGTPFVDPLYVVESSLVDELLNATLPEIPDQVIAASTLLQKARGQNPRLARHFTWLRVDIAAQYGIEPARWPEAIAFRSQRDTDILRGALVLATQDVTGSRSLVELWKRASVVVRQRRLGSEGGNTRHVYAGQHDRIRILYGSSSAGFTGAQQSLCHLIGALDRSRYEPIAVVSYGGVFTDELRRRGVTVICPNEDIGINNLENLHFAQRLIKEYEPDIVHSNHSIGMPLAFVARAAGLPLVQHVRVQAPRGIRELIYAADAVIAVSHFIRAKLAELDIDLAKVEVIWNGVDVDEVKPDPLAQMVCRQRLEIPLDEFVIVMVARLAPNKRHDLVIDAVGRLRRSIGRGHLVLVAGFDGDRAYAHRIRAQIRDEGIADHTTILEFVGDVRPVLHASDVMALPSEEEPLARAVLEAMAVGRPAVVANSGGTKEIIDPGKTGLVVQSGSAEPLAAALRDLAENLEWAKTMGAAAAEKVRASLTARHCAERTMRLYDRVLGAARAPHVTIERQD
jgi:glycosyltransferase involved in cell wall biosynthesis